MAEPLAPADLEELLFSYAAGTLDAAQRQRVEAMLAADPSLQQQLKWYESVSDAVVDSLPAPGRLPSAEHIAKRIRRKDISSTENTKSWFAWLAPVAAGLIVVQAVAIGVMMMDRREEQAYRSVSPGGQAAKSVVFVIAFNPDTPESKLRALLLKAGATIVEGPKQMGDYRVAVPANKAQYAKQLFEDSGIAEYVRTE
jgi:anti-sigma-K factor RskA